MSVVHDGALPAPACMWLWVVRLSSQFDWPEPLLPGPQQPSAVLTRDPRWASPLQVPACRWVYAERGVVCASPSHPTSGLVQAQLLIPEGTLGKSLAFSGLGLPNWSESSVSLDLALYHCSNSCEGDAGSGQAESPLDWPSLLPCSALWVSPSDLVLSRFHPTPSPGSSWARMSPGSRGLETALIHLAHWPRDKGPNVCADGPALHHPSQPAPIMGLQRAPRGHLLTRGGRAMTHANTGT